MRMRARIAIFAVAAVALTGLYVRGTLALAKPGDVDSIYAREINARALSERHVTDAVTAVNFDYRALDTLGEEFILFASVIGALVLLREEKEKECGREDGSRARGKVPASESVSVWTLGMTGPTVLFGLYIVSHGQLTPGGGFQGGVILATAPLLVFLAKSFDTFRKITGHEMLEAGEAIGAAGFALLGIVPLFWGAPFLKNFLPYGSVGSIYSGGTMPLISATTGLEVAGGFVLLLTGFIQYLLETGAQAGED